MSENDKSIADAFLEEVGSGPDPEELKGVESFVASLFAALKNYSLLPEEHATTRKMIAAVHKGLVSFQRDFGNLKLDIGKETLHYRGEEVHRGPSTSDNLAYICCRDGIIWLEFQEGIESWELTRFFRLINRYRVLLEEPEDDLVSAIWEENFPHIAIEANDDLWEAEPVLEFSMINPAGLRQIYEKSSGSGILGGMFSLDGGGKGQGGGGAGSGGGTGDGIGEGVGSGSEGGTGEGVESGGGSGSGGGTGDEVGSGSGSGIGDEVGSGGGGSGSGGGIGDEVGSGGGSGSGGGMGDEVGSGGGGSGSGGGIGDEVGSGGGGSGSGGGIGDGVGSGGGMSGKGAGFGGAGVGGGRGDGIGSGGPGELGSAIHVTGSRNRYGEGVEESGDDAPIDYRGHIAVSIASPEISHDLWRLSDEEQAAIAAMVEQEEARVIGNDVVEMLMTVLIRENDPRIFESILNFMLEEFRNLLELRDFTFAYALLSTIGKIRDRSTGKREWTRPLLDKYFNDISEPEILEALMPVWPELSSLDQKNLHKFAAIMQFLPGKAGASFGPMINEVREPGARKLFIDIVVSFARRDVETMKSLLERPEEDMAAKLLHGLDPDRDREAEGIIADKIIHHPRVAIRREGLAILIRWASREYRKLTTLLDDSDREVRDTLLGYLGQRRSEEVEDLLQEYLGRERYQIKGAEHIIDCYRALGQCGSVRSIPYLKKVLTGQKFNFVSGLGTPAHRQGAALALAGIDTPECVTILKKTAESSMPHIRSAAQKALTEM